MKNGSKRNCTAPLASSSSAPLITDRNGSIWVKVESYIIHLISKFTVHLAGEQCVSKVSRSHSQALFKTPHFFLNFFLYVVGKGGYCYTGTFTSLGHVSPFADHTSAETHTDTQTATKLQRQWHMIVFVPNKTLIVVRFPYSKSFKEYFANCWYSRIFKGRWKMV